MAEGMYKKFLIADTYRVIFIKMSTFILKISFRVNHFYCSTSSFKLAAIFFLWGFFDEGIGYMLVEIFSTK